MGNFGCLNLCHTIFPMKFLPQEEMGPLNSCPSHFSRAFLSAGHFVRSMTDPWKPVIELRFMRIQCMHFLVKHRTYINGNVRAKGILAVETDPGNTEYRVLIECLGIGLQL
jgi:hypothetical protein